MARIKFTGPVSTVQLQPTPILQGLLSKGDVSAQTERQAEVENISRSIVEESTSLKQQQSLELVQIMLHVSVSTPGRICFIFTTKVNRAFIARDVVLSSVSSSSPFPILTDILICASQSEFLPLPCFDDRDLKEAQRENTLSYREFIDGKPRPGGTAALSQVAFGTGRRGQPLKIIVRDSDPKANMILDVLVRLLSTLVLIQSIDGSRKTAYSMPSREMSWVLFNLRFLSTKISRKMSWRPILSLSNTREVLVV